MKARMLALAAVLLIGQIGTAAAAAPIQRFVLVIGANAGGADRPKLQYALSDAERFARVMVDLGGVPAGNEVILKQPRLKELIDALDALNARVTTAKKAPGAGRVEVILYYSGHADELGLLLGADRYSYRTLRDRLDDMPADVRIAVLDACASGAFTRLKGGRARPPFLVDESADMRGHAFLTSSAATESAQESDRIHASYFTHYLISGFRGAADLSGDGKVTLNEAYQFAFNETLGKTVDTRGGAQHPSYDINLSGSGDVIMTDVRQTTATLVLNEDLDGRFFVRTPAQELVVELYKPFGRRVELGLEPGVYEVRLDREKTSMLAKTKVDEGARVVLEPKQFGAVALEHTRARGDVPKNVLAVSGRNRIELRFGTWSPHQSFSTSGVTLSGSSIGVFGGLGFTHYMREDLAMTVNIIGEAAGDTSSITQSGVYSGGAGAVSLPVGVRWFPLVSHAPPAVKPYLAVSVGPTIGAIERTYIGAGRITASSATTTIGGHAGGGVDFHLGRPFSIGLDAGYNWASHELGGPEIGITFGFLFGKGSR